MLPIQVLNTKGAARRLGCSETWIHKLAATGKFRAYIYGEEGELIEHEKETRKQVRALSFLAEDVEQYRPAVQRRPRGGKNRCPQLLTHLFVCTKNQRGGGAWNRRDTGLTQWAVVACKLLDSLVVVTKKQPPGASHIHSEHGRKGW